MSTYKPNQAATPVLPELVQPPLDGMRTEPPCAWHQTQSSRVSHTCQNSSKHRSQPRESGSPRIRLNSPLFRPHHSLFLSACSHACTCKRHYRCAYPSHARWRLREARRPAKGSPLDSRCVFWKEHLQRGSGHLPTPAVYTRLQQYVPWHPLAIHRTRPHTLLEHL